MSSKIIIALDFDSKEEVEQLISKLNPKTCRLKVGITLFTQLGPQWIQGLHSQGFEVFLDFKFHDIPHQVGGACKAASKLGVWMINVHALGGLAMLEAARKATVGPLLIGVTVLTSSGPKELTQLGLPGTPEDNVIRLAKLCFEAGLDGVVCSAHEVSLLKKTFGQSFLCVTPGIRLAGEATQDQQRVMTPQEAIKLGSDYLVMGRSITGATSPNLLLNEINAGIS